MLAKEFENIEIVSAVNSVTPEVHIFEFGRINNKRAKRYML